MAKQERLERFNQHVEELKVTLKQENAKKVLVWRCTSHMCVSTVRLTVCLPVTSKLHQDAMPLACVGNQTELLHANTAMIAALCQYDKEG